MACNAEAPHLQKLFARVKDRGGRVVGIATSNDEESGVASFRRRHHLTYPIAFDRSDLFDHERTDVPLTVLVDGAGVVVFIEEGYDRELFAALEKRFSALLPR